jgi:hypothetical protein
VVRGSDPQKIDAAAAEIDAMIAGLVASGAS